MNKINSLKIETNMALVDDLTKGIENIKKRLKAGEPAPQIEYLPVLVLRDKEGNLLSVFGYSSSILFQSENGGDN